MKRGWFGAGGAHTTVSDVRFTTGPHGSPSTNLTLAPLPFSIVHCPFGYGGGTRPVHVTLHDAWPTQTAWTAAVRFAAVPHVPGATPALQSPVGSPKLTKVTASMALLGHATLAGCPSGTLATHGAPV